MRLPSFCAVILCLDLLLSPAAMAESPFYIRTALGPAIADDITLGDDFDGEKLTVDYAASFGLAGGWQINRWIAAELETGAVYTHMDRIYDGGASGSAHASLIDIPLTANLVLRYERPEHRWSGYIRGGFGAAGGRFSMSGADEGEATSRGTDWDVVLAYRLGAGAGYRISNRWSVELGYELFGTGGSAWDLHYEDGEPVRMGFDSVRVHSLQCAFKFQF